jgi:histidine kinase/histidine kinase/DNA gyrase B/HSP90-like ATPase
MTNAFRSDAMPGAIRGMAKPATYSWAWCRQRALFWLPCALVFGIGSGLWHAASMGAWGDFANLSLHATLGCVVIVSSGRLAACLMRQMKQSRAMERLLVVAAIAGGFVIACAVFGYLAHFHEQLMTPYRGMDMSMGAHEVVRSLVQKLGDALGNVPTWIALFLVSGGYDLPAYLSEQRRLLEARRQREVLTLRTEKTQADMQLAVLQAQIEPHFLFNTLASVRSIILTEPGRAVATIDALSDYLRSTLPRLRGGAVLEMPTLGAQIEICKNYLELMKIRMGGRLSFEIHVPGAAAAAPFPPLLLLPLVENAVKHGIEPKRGPAIICIRAVLDNEDLTVTVEDDGLGLRRETGSGLGLANVQAQLRNYFGDNASLSVMAAKSGGVCSTIAIPAGAA